MGGYLGNRRGALSGILSGLLVVRFIFALSLYLALGHFRRAAVSPYRLKSNVGPDLEAQGGEFYIGLTYGPDIRTQESPVHCASYTGPRDYLR